MDLLVITWNYPPRRGGIEGLIGSLCTELRKTHAVHVITSHARVSGFNEKNVSRSPLPGLMAFAVYAIWRGAILLARDPRIRVVFGGSAVATPLVLILARVLRRRAVVQIHGLDIIYHSTIYQHLCVRWLRFCDQVVANSRYTAGLAQAKGVLRDGITVIPPGIYPERFSKRTHIAANKRAWGVEGQKIILFVGRLARRKGVKEFIENCLVRVVREIPETVFLIVGDNPTESLTHRDDVVDEINAVTSKLGLENHVRLLGSLSDEDVIELYQLCDLVVLPVLDTKDDVEGFGIVALEAAAAGKPVVATRIGGIPDAVKDGEGGILVEAKDYKNLTKAILRLLNDSLVADAMGEAGRRRTEREFGWNETVDKYKVAFGHVTASKPIRESSSAQVE